MSSKTDTIESLQGLISSMEQTQHCCPVEENASGASDNSQAAYVTVLKMLSLRDYPVKVVREKLGSKGFNQNEIDEAIEKALHAYVLNDQRFASHYAQYHYEIGEGLEGIKRYLLQQNIAPEFIASIEQSILASDAYEEEWIRALKVIEAKPTHAKNQFKAAVEKLVRKGFSFEAAHKAVRVWIERQPSL